MAKPEFKKETSRDFWAESSFGELGFSEEIGSAMQLAGFPTPSSVQGLASKELLTGKDVVLAAETGSGKTLAYLLPIVQQLMTNDRHAIGALVLCPNTALCNQVVSVLENLRRTDGSQLVKAVRIASSKAPPKELPDVLVSTPAGLISAAREYRSSYGSSWTQEGIVKRCRWVVVDEADLLMTGGYVRDTRKILQSMRLADNLEKSEAISRTFGISLEDFQDLPRLVRQSGLKGDLVAVKEALEKRQNPDRSNTSLLSTSFQRSDGTPQNSEHAEKQRDVVADLAEGQGARVIQHMGSSGDNSLKRFGRQYIFVAATMPHVGKRAVGSEIAAICPEAVWLSGQQLHQSIHKVQHMWHEVDNNSWASTLEQAVRDSIGEKSLIFASTVAAAEETVTVLHRAGIDSLKYHKDVSQVERDHVLNQAYKRKTITIVSTDAAARGLDIPDVTHVIQADFASSAIDFLHRVGRTGRAGKGGRVTSLYDSSSKALAEAIRDAVESGEPIEGAFSRNRSFRNKMRRYGRYVPRGHSGLTQIDQTV